MSYNLKLFRKEIRKKYVNDFSFLEHEERLESFTDKQKATLKRRLNIYGYQVENESESNTIFNFRGGELGITAFMTQTCLTFSCAGGSEEGLFEIIQTADELSDSEFLTLNLQEGAWSGMCLEAELEAEEQVDNHIETPISMEAEEKQIETIQKPWWKFW